MLTEAQKEIVRKDAEAIGTFIDATRNIETKLLYRAIEAVIEARPQHHPPSLEWLAQRLSRKADDLERESR